MSIKNQLATVKWLIDIIKYSNTVQLQYIPSLCDFIYNVHGILYFVSF
jgi:hypothetical protein